MTHIFHNTTFFTLPKIIESGRLKTEDGFISFSNTFPSKHLPFGDIVIALNKERLDKKNIEFIELPYDTTDPKTFEFFEKNPDIYNYFMEGKSKDDFIKDAEKEIENCKTINRPDWQKMIEKDLAAYKSADPLSHLKCHLEKYEREGEILVKGNEITIVPDDIEFIIASSRTLTPFYPINNKIINKKKFQYSSRSSYTNERHQPNSNKTLRNPLFLSPRNSLHTCAPIAHNKHSQPPSRQHLVQTSIIIQSNELVGRIHP